jgi:hypothetical protein
MVFFIAKSAFCARRQYFAPKKEFMLHGAKRKEIVDKLFALNNPGGYKEMSSIFAD